MTGIDPKDLQGNLRQFPRPGTVTLRPYRERRMTARWQIISGLFWLALIAGIIVAALLLMPDGAGGLP